MNSNTMYLSLIYKNVDNTIEERKLRYAKESLHYLMNMSPHTYRDPAVLLMIYK